MTITPVSAPDAERRAMKISLRLDTIADNYEAVVPMIRESLELRDHEALGYRSPGDYLADRFGKALARLPIALRRETVAAIDSVETLSTRSLAPVFDVDNKTIHNDRRALSAVETSTPEPSHVERTVIAEQRPVTLTGVGHVNTATGEILDTKPITGMDGKAYNRPAPTKPRTAPRRALTDQFFDAVYDMTKQIERVERLTNDDRFNANKEKVAQKHLNDLIQTHDLLQQVIDSLSN